MQNILLVPVPSGQASAAKRDLLEAHFINFATLFGSEQWWHVTYAAIARDENGALIGLATLAMQGEDGESSPEIVGVWVHPRVRRQGIGTRLLIACVDKALALGWQKPVRIFGVTIAGHALARRAFGQGLNLDVRSSEDFGVNYS